MRINLASRTLKLKPSEWHKDFKLLHFREWSTKSWAKQNRFVPLQHKWNRSNFRNGKELQWLSDEHEPKDSL